MTIIGGVRLMESLRYKW